MPAAEAMSPGNAPAPLDDELEVVPPDEVVFEEPLDEVVAADVMLEDELDACEIVVLTDADERLLEVPDALVELLALLAAGEVFGVCDPHAATTATRDSAAALGAPARADHGLLC